MEIGNRIKQFRLQKGITQELMAQHFNVTPQAISKWERGAATPDISLLPELSAYFGVSIDELFALSDDTRMERIQNMIWDVRYFDPSVAEKEKQFLIEKGSREPANSKPYELLADLENHLAKEHRELAESYAKEALKRDPNNKSAHGSLIEAMNGQVGDWYVSNHFALIQYYQKFVDENPKVCRGYMWLIDHLLEAGRLKEAREYCEIYQTIDTTFRGKLYQGYLYWYSGDRKLAFACWEQMMEAFPDEWMAFFSVADMYARCGDYDKAKELYYKSLESQSSPRFTDPYESIAQVCELQGNIREAIDILNEELKTMGTDWNVVCGETADYVRRNIARLEKML